MKRIAVTLAAATMLIAPATSMAAGWRGHVVTARFDGQIDASPCPSASCLKGIVGIYVDGMDVRDHLVRCAWPRHPKVIDFRRHHHHHQAEVHTCGRNYWWRFR